MTAAGTDITQTAAALIDAVGRADWDTVRDLVAPDVIYAETGTERRVQGADAYIELCREWKEAFPGMSGTILRAIGSGDTVAQEILWEGAHHGPLSTPMGTHDPSGSEVAVYAATWTTFAGGRATEIHHHLDVFALLQQIGVPG
jgi:predicted ester cyclase